MIALVGEAWLVGVLSCIPKGCGFDPRSGRVREATNWCVSVTSMLLALSHQWIYPQVNIEKELNSLAGVVQWTDHRPVN